MKYFIFRIPSPVKLIRAALPSSRTPNPWSPGSHWWLVDFDQCGRFRRNLDTFGSVNLSGMDFCSFVRLWRTKSHRRLADHLSIGNRIRVDAYTPASRGRSCFSHWHSWNGSREYLCRNTLWMVVLASQVLLRRYLATLQSTLCFTFLPQLIGSIEDRLWPVPVIAP
jgi:hypothetical protein